jgi:hypothetical protein
MAGFIDISEKQTWSAANWVYWGLMDYMIDAVVNEPELAHRVETCKWMQGLDMPSLREDDPVLAEKVFLTLKQVSEQCAGGTLQCKVEGRILDDASQQQFRESMNELVNILTK